MDLFRSMYYSFHSLTHSGTVGAMPVGVRCLVHHSSPVASVPCPVTCRLQGCSTPLCNIIDPLSVGPASSVPSLHYSEYQGLDFPIVCHPADMTEQVHLPFDHLAHQVLFHLHSLVELFVADFVGPPDAKQLPVTLSLKRHDPVLYLLGDNPCLTSIECATEYACVKNSEFCMPFDRFAAPDFVHGLHESQCCQKPY